MKIGIYDPYLDTMAGGERYLLSAALCLSKKHDVTLFWDTSVVDEIKEKAKYRFDFDLTPLTFADNVFSPRVSLLSRFRESRKYDKIIYLSDGSIPTVATSLLLHFQTPVEWVNPSLKTFIKTRFVSHFVCNSWYTKTYIDRKFQVDSDVIYPPVSVKGNPGEERKENIILNVGRFGINTQGSSFKKQDVLAEVFKHMHEKGLRNWMLVFVMNVREEDSKKLDEFKKRFEKYNIRVSANPKNEELWEYYKKAKIYWHGAGFGEDLQKHPDRAEHFGISTVEAMSDGCVPVVFNGGGQKEIVTEGENGYVFETVTELVEKTKKLIEEKNQLNEFSGLARKRAMDFSEDIFCRSFHNLVG